MKYTILNYYFINSTKYIDIISIHFIILHDNYCVDWLSFVSHDDNKWRLCVFQGGSGSGGGGGGRMEISIYFTSYSIVGYIRMEIGITYYSYILL